MGTRQVWKFPLIDKGVVMPVGSQLLCVQMQNGIPCIWAIVDPEAPKEKVNIRVYGTGHEIPEDAGLGYLGTVQDGPFVWHFFNDLTPAHDEPLKP
jgi:hypothetical protein